MAFVVNDWYNSGAETMQHTTGGAYEFNMGTGDFPKPKGVYIRQIASVNTCNNASGKLNTAQARIL